MVSQSHKMFSSAQSLDRLGHHGDMRDDPADPLLVHPFRKRLLIVSSSGIGKENSNVALKDVWPLTRRFYHIKMMMMMMMSVPADELSLGNLLQLQHLVHLVDIVVAVELPDAVLGDHHLGVGLLVALEQVKLELLVCVVVGDHLPVLLRPTIKGQFLAKIFHLSGWQNRIYKSTVSATPRIVRC